MKEKTFVMTTKTKAADNADIQELLCNIENYINSQIVPKIKFETKHHAKLSKSIIEAEAKNILTMFSAANNKNLLDIVSDKICSLYEFYAK